MHEQHTYDLERFVAAQDPVYARVLSELAAAHKRTHWMWFVFPQLKGLGRSHMAQRYALSCLDEARAYVAHPVLGPRLRECTNLVNQARGRSILEILGTPDDMKFHSCMTLFTYATGDDEPFEAALQKYFGGARDPLTLERL